MTSNGRIHKHRSETVWHFALDALIIVFAFVVGTRIRFADGIPGLPDETWLFKLELYLPGILGGAITLPVFLYIAGLYTTRFARHRSPLQSYLILCGLFLAATVVMLAFFYVNYSTRVGRGVMVISWPTAAVLLFIHHSWLLATRRRRREKVAFLLGSDDDVFELSVLRDSNHTPFRTVGVIANDVAHASALGGMPYLGRLDKVVALAKQHQVDRLVCSGNCLQDPTTRTALCQLRYSAVVVSSFLSLCEEEFHFAPLELVTPNWLVNASDSPRHIYIKKIKRGFDVVASLGCIVALSPFLLLGMLAVKLTSKGPVFYRQERLGRFGRPFTVVKLRTMVEDAEKEHGAQWSVQDDSRLTRAGHFLRKYRIDEIPQLFSVLRGEMSFVGPRPERPEFVEQLEKEVPWYRERLLVQPGLTGWAQVNYPYGASVEDAARKLEYDLYYMKHMGLYLDVAILLSTVRTILTGANQHSGLSVDPLRRDFAAYASPEAAETPGQAVPVPRT